MVDSIIIGCGFAGAVVANQLAVRANKRVLIIEKRNHLGGNAYDKFDDSGVLIHQYGPHIFHTNCERVVQYLSEFTQWIDYHHEVLAYINGQYVPVPFNLNSLYQVYHQEKAEQLKQKLLSFYKYGSKVPILELQNNQDEEIREVAEYIYQNIFLKYTMKQWGKTPDEIDPNVTARVPIVLSEDNGYFQDTFQGMPLDGYTPIFHKMLDHPNITISLNIDANDMLTFTDKQVLFKGEAFSGEIIYTGAIDELLDYKFGRLPYRTLNFQFEHYQESEYQPSAVVNYTVSEEFTRITEFKKLTGQIIQGTTIVKEYPGEYTGKAEEIPYYSINNEYNDAIYRKYADFISKYKSFYLLGRLAEYKYFNMDAIIESALKLSDKIINH